MSTTMAQRRKGGSKPDTTATTFMDPLEMEDVSLLDNDNNSNTPQAATQHQQQQLDYHQQLQLQQQQHQQYDPLLQPLPSPHHHHHHMVPATPVHLVATVRRRFIGTGPFDKHWLNLDICGLFCALFTYGLHVFGAYAVCTVVLPPWMSVTDAITHVRTLAFVGQFVRASFLTCTLLAMVSHFKAMTTDPGAVPPDAKPLPDLETSFLNTANGVEVESLIPLSPAKRLCRRCKSFKPQRAHHCSICRRCIIKMDHHCPWVNNCVGIGNHKYFLLFIFYTFVTCIYSIVLVVLRFIYCIGDKHSYQHVPIDAHHSRHVVHLTCLDHPTQLLTILGLIVESVLFGMFTSCMMFDQSEVIHSKLTHIDRLKGASVGGSIEGIIEVFGMKSNAGNTTNNAASSSFRMDWLSPFSCVCFPPSLRDEVMGFCRSCNTNTTNESRQEDELDKKSGNTESNGKALRLTDVL